MPLLDELRDRRKYLSLEAGRFFAAFLVVLFHTGLTLARPKYLGYYPVAIFAGGFSGVDFFFVLSGFVIVGAHYEDLHRPPSASTARTFLWKRFVRLYPALWGILIVLVPAILLVDALKWAGPVSVGDVLSAFAVSPFPSERILAVEWTLRYEILFYSLIAVALWNRTLGLIGFASLIGMSSASYITDYPGLFGFFWKPYPILFLVGGTIAFMCRRIALRWARPAFIAGTTIFLARLGDCAVHPVRDGGPQFWDTTIFGLGAALIVYGLVAWENKKPIRVPDWLLYLGKASYALYLVHFPVISLTANAVKRLHFAIPGLMLMVSITIIAVISGILYHELVEKPLTGLFRRFRPA